jgi:hypothetical protein
MIEQINWLKKRAIFFLVITIISMVYACEKNRDVNNRVTESVNKLFISESSFLTGHSEFTLTKNGLCGLKIYPSLGHRYYDSIHYIDLNGDGMVDWVRQNGSEFMMNTNQLDILREFDYDQHQQDFIDADKILKYYIQKYSSVINKWKGRIKP